MPYPLPSFSGAAQAPSAVDLFINGYRTSSHVVQPGPFTLRETPYVNGAGEAVVVTSDAQGRQVRVTIPFYVATTLLRPGLTDYAVSLGILRRDYGIKSFSYGSAAASAALRHGLTNDLTVELTAQRAGSLTLIGAGGALKLGNLGAVNSSLAWNWYDGRSGRQWTVGYQYQSKRLSFIANHTRRSHDFRDMTGYANFQIAPAQQQTQIRANVVLPENLGAIGAGLLASRRGDDRFRIGDLTYNRALGASTLNIMASRDFRSRAFTVLAQVIVPLGRGGTVMAGGERTSTGAVGARLDYHRTIPSDGGLGWDLMARTGSGQTDAVQGSVTFRSPVTQVQAGLTANGDRTGWWGSLSGAAVWMDGGLFAANRINDAFTLVSTDGVGGVPVMYENQQVGVTNRNGHLFIPWVPPYYGAKYEIDLLNLSADLSAPTIEQRAAVKLGSGQLVRFPIQKLSAAHIVLRDGQGRLLDPGTSVVVNGTTSTFVGYDGLVYLENLNEANQLTAKLPDGSECRASFPFMASGMTITRIGPLTCQ